MQLQWMLIEEDKEGMLNGLKCKYPSSFQITSLCPLVKTKGKRKDFHNLNFSFSTLIHTHGTILLACTVIQ